MSSTTHRSKPLRIGFIPEHFSTPIHFAQTHFDLNADLHAVPLGTGHLTKLLAAGPSQTTPGNDGDEHGIDVAVGLTEGFVADLGRKQAAGEISGDGAYGLVGTYVETPLCWGITVGADRRDINSVADLKGRDVGVSRMGSGSHVMASVLADQQGWRGKDAFEVKVIGNFKALRDAVNAAAKGSQADEVKKADFFMWEHFTTKRFWDLGEVKRVGEIYTPWPSWVVAARNDVPRDSIDDLLKKLDQGIQHYLGNTEEAVQHITSVMEYSDEDAREWMRGVRFASSTAGVDSNMVAKTIGVLQKANVLNDKAGGPETMITQARERR